MEEPSWSNKQLRRLGESIRDERTPPADLPRYDEVMLHYNELASRTQSRLMDFDWTLLLGGRTFEITSRSKTIDTLRQKLQRDHATPLSSIRTSQVCDSEPR
ncbi:hypothetical protein ACQ7DA_10660 [Zafaria sp. J156]|uniref:hypothetical protein n=1 Tax=Zafaria sp. J156 TaxID=3116490 RepID=UPI002E7A185B|nr:hypothetical protein [Zafaria sp. J156]MEE1621639.1 hypothetical protein [Zafaria sp. J156]